MNAEIIMIGSELLLGQIVDTNSAYLAKELAGIGINLFYKTTIGDNRQRMAEAFEAAMERSEIVITSGGLGPTEDDLTREIVAEVVGEPLEFHQGLYDQIEALFKKHGFTMSPNNRKQAFIPRNAIPIENPVGTAPGFIAEKGNSAIITLPGVPSELMYLTENAVLPYLQKKYSLGETNIRSRVLKVCGKGESSVDAIVGDLIKNSNNPTVGILAHPAEITLRITAKAATVEEADEKIAGMEAEIRGRLGSLIFGSDDDTLESVVGKLLAEKSQTLALLETQTGGGVAQRFTSIDCPALIEAIVTRSDDVLRRIAGSGIEKAQGTDHCAFCVDLARGVREKAGTDIGVAALGISAGSDELAPEEKASGKTCIAIDSGGSSPSSAYWEFRFAGTDTVNQRRATVLTIEVLRRFLTGYVDPDHPHRTPSAR
jgi:nicotinamide-nucleotide amidase